MRTIAGAMKWGVWGASLSTQEMQQLIEGCLKEGVDTFDHADIYGGYTTEKEWGDAWKPMGIEREKIEIITKCGICLKGNERPDYKINSYNGSKEHIINSAMKSIENLNCDYLDLLLFHRPSPLMDPIEIGKAFSYLKTEGLVKKFGVSNFTIPQMDLIKKVHSISVNQIEISMLHIDGMHDGTIDYCTTHKIEVQAWSPIGTLFSPSADAEFVLQRARLKEVADGYGWTLDEMAYLFLLHHPADIRPVVGSSKIDRILTSVKCEQTSITDEQWFEIWTASKGHSVP